MTSQPKVTQETAQAHSFELPALHLAAQRGDVDSLRKLVTSETINEPAEDGTYALQWAASNNHWKATSFLLENGADPNLKGPVDATALHWVIRSGHVYMAKMLIDAGADAAAVDSQKYTPLHVAVHSSNVLMVIYLLHLDSPADANKQDTMGRTPLHWAAYQGDHLSVQSLLKAGGDPNIKDSQGFIPLHWALVSKNQSCLQALIAGGSDLTSRTADNKTCWVVAQEMGAQHPWGHALRMEYRWPESGIPVPQKISRRAAKITLFILPLIMCPLSIKILLIPNYFGIPLLLLLSFLVHRLCSKYLYPKITPGHHALVKSPVLTGIFNAMFFWIVFVYFYYVMVPTWQLHKTTNLIFLPFPFLIFVFYSCSALMDPGIIKPGSFADRREAINALIDRGIYDADHFCPISWTRKPPRAQYSKFPDSVIAKFDHYCPWTYNCVGIRNHRMFMLFLIFLLSGIAILARLYVAYLYTLSDTFWGAVIQTKFSAVMFAGILFQSSWILLLTVTQLVQIARGLTTEELSDNGASEKFISLPPDHPLAVTVSVPAAPPAPAHRRKHGGALVTCLKLLGVHHAVSSTRRRKTRSGYGVYTNCTDFWCIGCNIFTPSGRGRLNGEPLDYMNEWEAPESVKVVRGSDAENALSRLV